MSRRSWIILNVVLDALAVNGAVVLAFIIRFGWPLPAFNFDAYQRVFIPLTLGQLAIFFLVGLYDPAAERSGPESLGTVIKGVLLGSVALVVLSFSLRAFSFPRTVILAALITQVLFIWGWRLAASSLLHVRWPERRVVLVGAGDDVVMVAERLARAERWGYRVAGVVVESDRDAAGLAGLPVHAGLGALPDILGEHMPDQVIVATPARHRRVLEEIALSPHFQGEVFVVPQVYEMHLGEVDFSLLDDLPLLRITRSPRPAWQQVVKVVAERTSAALSLVLLSPVLLVVAGAVVLFSGLPVFYKQTRVGFDRLPFSVYKFRTMVRDAEREGAVLAAEDDPRVTRIGRVLRASRLDEVPQLLNVLKGEMSFVGPRPERPEFVEQFMREDPLYAERFRVRPGITGLAQVSAAYATTAQVKLRFDLMYVYHQSLALDLRILFRTVQVVLTGRGAR